MIDPLRHLEVFSPAEFGSRRVDVIGCGATGSKVAMSLAKLGITNLHLWDFDTVEEHNIANQHFYQADIGFYKAEAMQSLIYEATHQKVDTHIIEAKPGDLFGEIIFLLTDTMKSRKEIYDNCIKYKLNTQLLIETRMTADMLRIYAIHTSNLKQLQEYEKTFYADEEAPVSACGASTTVGATADIVAGMAVWQMLKWLKDPLDIDNETILCLRPSYFETKKF